MTPKVPARRNSICREPAVAMETSFPTSTSYRWSAPSARAAGQAACSRGPAADGPVRSLGPAARAGAAGAPGRDDRASVRLALPRRTPGWRPADEPVLACCRSSRESCSPISRPSWTAGTPHHAARAGQSAPTWPWRSARAAGRRRIRPRRPARLRCPLDRALDDSGAAFNDGMRQGCYRVALADLGASTALRT